MCCVCVEDPGVERKSQDQTWSRYYRRSSHLISSYSLPVERGLKLTSLTPSQLSSQLDLYCLCPGRATYLPPLGSTHYNNAAPSIISWDLLRLRSPANSWELLVSPGISWYGVILSSNCEALRQAISYNSCTGAVASQPAQISADDL